MKTIILHNHKNYGDVILSRPLIRDVMKLDVPLILSVRSEAKKFYLRDLGIPFDDELDELPDYYMISTWAGFHRKRIRKHRKPELSYDFLKYSFNYQAKLQQIDFRIENDKIGVVGFPFVDVGSVKRPSVLIENAQPKSSQSNFQFSVSIAERLVARFPSVTFYFSNRRNGVSPNRIPNVMCLQDMNLTEISYLSNQVDAIVSVGSGVNAATYTTENIHKPRAIMGWLHDYELWRYEGNTTQYLHTYEEMEEFLSLVFHR